MDLSVNQVIQIADLAALKLSSTEAEHYRQQLQSVVEYVAQLSHLELSSEEPVLHPLGLKDQMRSHTDAKAVLDHVAVLANTQPEGDYFRVPQILQEGNAST